MSEAELEVLEELVSQELMVQEMLRLGIDVTASDVDQALDDELQLNWTNKVSGEQLGKSELEQELRCAFGKALPEDMPTYKEWHILKKTRRRLHR